MSDEYTITLDQASHSATLSGVLRLSSPVAYRPVMQPIQDAIEAGPPSYRVDLRGLSFMNSSGVTALSRLVMAARQHDVPLVCVVNDAVPWQRKTLSSLARLYPKIELVTA